MATRTKPKGKTKHKKPPVTKAGRRRKTAAKKTKTIRKKGATKQPKRISPKKKTSPTAKAAVKPRPVTEPAQPEAARPAPSSAAQPAPTEERIGIVTHYYSRLSVATVRLESGTLRVGDVIHIRGHNTDFNQTVESLEVNHAAVTEVGPNDDFGLKVGEPAREHDIVFKVRS
jgi:hypothetical protein